MFKTDPENEEARNKIIVLMLKLSIEHIFTKTAAMAPRTIIAHGNMVLIIRINCFIG